MAAHAVRRTRSAGTASQAVMPKGNAVRRHPAKGRPPFVIVPLCGLANVTDLVDTCVPISRSAGGAASINATMQRKGLTHVQAWLVKASDGG